MTTIEQIFDAIRGERQYQDAKWGTIEQNPHSMWDWATIAYDQLYESRIKIACCEDTPDKAALFDLLKVIAVLVACLEQYGIVERPSPNER